MNGDLLVLPKVDPREMEVGVQCLQQDPVMVYVAYKLGAV